MNEVARPVPLPGGAGGARIPQDVVALGAAVTETMDGPHGANYYLSMSCGSNILGASSDSTDLCTSCGLCCGGAVFDSIPFPQEEVGAVTALGVEPYEDPPGQPRFDLPCRHLRGTKCGIYEQRPSTCRTFRCELLTALDDGRHTISSAKSIVEKAKALIDDIVPLIASTGKPITPRHWGQLLDQWRIDTIASKATPDQARAVLKLALLNRFIDTHFRSSDRHVVKLKPRPKKL